MEEYIREILSYVESASRSEMILCFSDYGEGFNSYIRELRALSKEFDEEKNTLEETMSSLEDLQDYFWEKASVLKYKLFHTALVHGNLRGNYDIDQVVKVASRIEKDVNAIKYMTDVKQLKDIDILYFECYHYYEHIFNLFSNNTLTDKIQIMKRDDRIQYYKLLCENLLLEKHVYEPYTRVLDNLICLEADFVINKDGVYSPVEMCLYDGEKVANFNIFVNDSPPYRTRSTVRWIKRHFENTRVNGTCDLGKVVKKVKEFLDTRKNAILFTKGSEKSKLLSLLLDRNVFNAETDFTSIPKYEKMSGLAPTCLFHSSKKCSLNKAMRLYNWITANAHLTGY